MINRSQLKFHETFQPEAGYIARILELASTNYSGSKFEISDRTGIPTGNQKGKVEPHIKYASFMGLISYTCEKGKYNLALTALGQEIYSQDPYLHETLTRWICHYAISRKINGAPQWAFLVNNAHVGYIQRITAERLLKQMENSFECSISFEEAFGVVKRSYTEGFFSSLEYLTVDEGTREFQFNEIQTKEELLFVYAYAMLSNWALFFPEKSEITLIEFIDELSFGKIFGLSDESIGEVLDELSDEGVIAVNRQLFPTTIIRMATSDDIIARLYSRLL